MKRKTSNIILVIMGAFLLLFIIAMTVVFVRVGSVPDSLVAGVFTICGFEGGVLGWIKTTKEKNKGEHQNEQN